MEASRHCWICTRVELLQMHTVSTDKCAYVQMHSVRFDKYANTFGEHIYTCANMFIKQLHPD